MLPRLKRKNCVILLLGSAIQAFGIYNIHALSQVTEGGAIGLTLLLHHWFGISPAISSPVLCVSNRTRPGVMQTVPQGMVRTSSEDSPAKKRTTPSAQVALLRSRERILA